jgi:transcriptional regulator with XRE-family HTH domain
MPTIAQIRAARALLDWSQADLADYAGLSQTGIARIENGTNKPNSSTLDKIKNAFDHADIEFIAESGVRKRTGEIRTYKGQDGFRTFMDDVYETAKTVGGDICLFNGMPKYFHQYLGTDWYAQHAKRMNEIRDNYKLKITVKEGEDLLIASEFAEYRHFPANLFKEKTFYSYGEKLAIMSFDTESVTIKVLSEPEISASFQILFDIAWDNVAYKNKNTG